MINDVIAAVSTPPGKGGVAVIRISGDGAFEVAERVFRSASGRSISAIAPRYQSYGYIVDGEEPIDDVLLSRFPAPNSYTGEDTVEISCHGGSLITRTVLEVLLANGARPADAGEFTRRAFVNGKLSLTEAEAIGTLLEAQSREQIRISAEPARRRLSEKIEEIRASLTSLMSSLYARIDYPDEDLGDYSEEELLSELRSIEKTIANLKNTYRTGRAITEGIDTAICGKTNVGKSSLYNLLLGEDAAIVTDIEGTTRDVLTRSAPLGRVMLRLHDTAGIRSEMAADEVERIGIEKSRQMMNKCELLFALFDISRPFDEQDEMLIKEIKSSSAVKIAILNKADLERKFELPEGIFDRTVIISTKREYEAISLLSGIVNELYASDKLSLDSSAIISSARQHAELCEAQRFVSLAKEALESGVMQDAVSSDIERALGAIAELDGRAVSEEVTSDIFSKFCVGK